jgi:hypothetical protein
MQSPGNPGRRAIGGAIFFRPNAGVAEGVQGATRASSMNRRIEKANLEARRGIIAAPGLTRGLWSYTQPRTPMSHRRFLSDVAQPDCRRATRHGRAGREGIVH